MDIIIHRYIIIHRIIHVIPLEVGYALQQQHVRSKYSSSVCFLLCNFPHTIPISNDLLVKEQKIWSEFIRLEEFVMISKNEMLSLYTTELHQLV